MAGMPKLYPHPGVDWFIRVATILECTVCGFRRWKELGDNGVGGWIPLCRKCCKGKMKERKE